MSASPTDLLSALLNGVSAINNLATKLGTTFLQASTVSTAAISAGTVVFSSSLSAASLLVTTSSGATYRLALYPSS